MISEHTIVLYAGDSEIIGFVPAPDVLFTLNTSEVAGLEYIDPWNLTELLAVELHKQGFAQAQADSILDFIDHNRFAMTFLRTH